ncbi:MAG: SUMF1/EgtB/PvdO family nonheme iron enzyme, partial [Delftia sp.]|nr:SUMF1/EgtB/PvdO family nonheme iron enzyme [Delftia sp.]
CLLALDGLDEVPHDLRGRVRQAATALIGRYRLRRVLITCRVRSYVGGTMLPAFQTHTLAPFDADKVRRFSRAWYNAQKELGRVDAQGAGRKAEDLAKAALGADLYEMSANPMMLTTMAIIHQQEIGLPRGRVRLYDLAVDVLLRRWQKRKVGERGLMASPALADLFRDDLRLRQMVERLAYEVHRAGQDRAGAADLSRGAALTLLERRECLGRAGLADEFLDYVDRRAGLLVGRGSEPGHPTSYGFPHRVFQEYLAGCYMAGERNAAREFFARAGQGDYWSLAAQLGAEELFYNRRSTGVNALLDLAYRLCPAGEPSDSRGRRAVLWSGNMASLAGRETIQDDVASPDGGPAYLKRLLPRLVNLLGSDLSAPERAQAGRVLARLGDPRFRAEAWLMPDEPLLGLVEIPAGPFLMGTREEDIPALLERFGGEREWYRWETPQHEVTLPTYYVARYPVTQAQFRHFVQTGGYR